MALDTYDPVLGLILQGTGNNNNAWGTTLNNSMIKLAARGVAGLNVHNVTGGTIDNSAAGSNPPNNASLMLDHMHTFLGALTSHQTVIVPAISKTWLVGNGTTGAFQVFFKTPGQAAPGIQIPQGTWKLIGCDGTAVFRSDAPMVGELVHNALNGLPAGQLWCNGQSLLRADYPDLFGKIGALWGAADGAHFSVPDFVTGNRFLRATGGGLGAGPGYFQASCNLAHNHSVTGAPSVGTLGTVSNGDHIHGATITDPGHGHNMSDSYQGTVGSVSYWTSSHSASGVGGGGAFGPAATFSIIGNGTGIRIWNGTYGYDTTLNAGAHAHTVNGAPGLGTLATSNDTSNTEARPNSAAVYIGIRF